MAGDANYDDVSLLLPFDGTDGSTTFTDEGPDGLSVSANGTCELDTAQKKWGTASLYVAGGENDRAFLTNNSSLIDFTGALSIQFWARPSSVGVVQEVTGSRNTSSNRGLAVFFHNTQLRIVGWSSSGSIVINTPVATPTTALVANAWNYCEITRSAGGTWYLFVGGVLQWSAAESGNIAQGNSTWAIGGSANTSTADYTGWLDDYRITNGLARNTAGYSVPTEAHGTEGLSGTILQLPSPLEGPEIVTNVIDPVAVRMSLPAAIGAPAINVTVPFETITQLPSPLAGPAVSALNDFTGLIGAAQTTYALRISGSPELEIPIKSWQSTLQRDRLSFVQAVIPAYGNYDISDRVGSETFSIYRVASAGGTTFESLMASAPLSTVQISQGSFNHTAVISGFSDEFVNSSAGGSRTLEGVRTLSNTINGASRLRCSIDWFLRPGQEVTGGGLTFTAEYINYYVTSSGQAYMDVGNRGAG